MAKDDQTPPPVRGPPPGATAPPEHVKDPQVYEIFPTKKESTNGPRASIADGFKTIKSEDFLSFYKLPCARASFLTGIGAGAVVGAGRFVLGAKIPRAANWAFGTFLLGSIVQYEVCQSQRYRERAAMARVVEVIDRKKAEKEAQAKEQARLRAEAEAKAKEEAARNKSWYKLW